MCAFLLMLDPPPNLEFGVDFMQWSVGDKFLGLKDLPAGPHLVHYGLGNVSRSGFWVFAAQQDAPFSFRWSKDAELFEPYDLRAVPEDAKCRLGSYAQEDDSWLSATCHVSRAVVAAHNAGKVLEVSHGRGTSAFDRSQELEKLLANVWTEDDILGWLQVWFWDLILCHDMKSFERWINLVSLLCSCVSSLRKRPSLFCRAVKVLTSQCERGGTDVIAPGDRLHKSLSIFVQDVQDDDDIDEKVKEAVELLILVLPTLTCNEAEDEPTVVDGDASM
jgi:hypothetical protein